MPEHGHDVCPHCEKDLVGTEATCPSCSGPLFGIAPKRSKEVENSPQKSEEIIVETPVRDAYLSEEESEKESPGTTLIDNIQVPTYTPPTMSSNSELQTEEPSANQSTSQDLVQRGEVFGIEGRHTDALRMFNQAISIDPTNHMAWFNRGVMSEATGDSQDALKSFKIALDNSPGHGAASANLAVLLSRLGDSEGAVKYALDGLIAFPGHPALTEIAGGAKNPVENQISSESVVEESSSASLQESTSSVITRSITTDSGVSTEDIESETVQEEPVEPKQEEPVWAEPQGNIKTLVAETTAPISEPASNADLTTSVFDLDTLAQKATELIKSGDAAGALETLRPYLPEEASEHAPSWRIAAGAMARLDLTDAAINAFEYSLDLDGSDASAWFNLGALKKRGMDYISAKDCFQRALDLDSSYGKAANGLAISATELGDISTAINAYRMLMSIDPVHQSAIIFANLLIDIAEGEGEVLEMDVTLPTTLPEGPEMAREALNLLPDVEIQLRARANTLAGEHATAVTLWKELLEHDKENPALWIGLSKSLSAAGSEEKAAQCREKARSLGAQIEEEKGHSEPEVIVEEETKELPILQPVAETSEQSLEQSGIVSEDDPWAAFGDTTEQIEETVTPFASPEEIVSHEAVLDTVSEPEPVYYEPVNEEVDLAAAALEAQANVTETHQVLADSSSIANQDIEWYNKGIELLNKDRHTEALSCFDRALPSFKDDKAMAIKILNGRGNCYYYLNQYKEAIENYYKAFGIDKSLTTGNALYNMGTAYAELESYENAIHCFEQSIGKEVGESLKGATKKRAKEQIRRCKLLFKEQKKRAS